MLKIKIMKKLKLNLQNIKSTEVLTREQLKKIMGGTGSGSAGVGWTAKCEAKCKNSTITCYGYNHIGCAAVDNSGCSGNDANGNSYYLTC